MEGVIKLIKKIIAGLNRILNEKETKAQMKAAKTKCIRKVKKRPSKAKKS